MDLGCGYGEFINNISATEKFGMDLNPKTKGNLNSDVTLFAQDCSSRWPMEDNTLDMVFTSNFFEHLPDKATLQRTLLEVRRCLTPGGVLIAMGPNIRYLPGSYWDFWDHYLPITERSLSEGLQSLKFEVSLCKARFLPYTMARGIKMPPFLVGLYLRLPIFWPIFGKQFLVVARK
ncbi:class I SAM-dependent methyltransferase [Ereboglobus luteus]|uniref:class I SAM-dependent methyltransferase n=1 Tax=Ereboglobus luteus TaxID=1796921 RepID=UPI0021502C75|nr:class I SAM-dependent methyltransferase [Ereboglobus luteus]